MSLRKELRFTWQGKEYQKTITFDVIQRVENGIAYATRLQPDGGLTLNTLFRHEYNGSVKMTDKALFVAAMMTECCGAEVKPEDIYEMMTNSKAGEVADLYGSMLWCVIGEEQEDALKADKKKKAERAAIT